MDLLPREALLCLFWKGKKTCFRFGFFMRKSLSKLINIESSFEDLDMRNPMMKMIQNLDARFKINVLNKSMYEKRKKPPGCDKWRMPLVVT